MGIVEFSWDSRMGPVIFIRHRNQKYGFAICHRVEDRCITICGHTSPLCARCTGILIGFLGLFLMLPMHEPITDTTILLSIAMMLPLLIDGFTQYMGLRQSNNILRFVSGMLFVPGFYSILRWLI